MAFIDTYTFTGYAGDGGNGVVRWTREKFRPKGGPCGGNGGKGGDFYIEGIRDINALSRLTHTHVFRAERGEDGAKASMTGRAGADFVLRIPIGSTIIKETGEIYEILEEGQRILILAGGVGGFGNEHFKSSTNRAPSECTLGKKGESAVFRIELRIIADIGLVGLPNAGKTSLLNALTRADARVGAYPFTTLDPNLGVYHDFVLADIPGIIEGAASGKGLGREFLRHVERTRVLVHCISFEHDILSKEYKTIRNELAGFGKLSDKEEYVVFTKLDVLQKEDAERKIHDFVKENPEVKIAGTLSILDDETIKKLADTLVGILTTR
jgi:GTP-binding protein